MKTDWIRYFLGFFSECDFAKVLARLRKGKSCSADGESKVMGEVVGFAF